MTTLVGEVMSREVFAVSPDTSLESAARMMATKRITGLPVVEDGRTVGVVSLVDLVDPDREASDELGYSTFYQITDGWAVRQGDVSGPGSEGRVGDVMTPATLSAEESTSVEEAARMMIEWKVHRLLVEKDGELTGIVSTMDLLRGFLSG